MSLTFAPGQMRSLRIFYSNDACTSGQLVIASRESQYKILHFHHGGMEKLAETFADWKFLAEARNKVTKHKQVMNTPSPRGRYVCRFINLRLVWWCPFCCGFTGYCIILSPLPIRTAIFLFIHLYKNPNIFQISCYKIAH